MKTTAFILFALALGACGNPSDSSKGNGTLQAVVILNVGPPHGIASDDIVADPNGRVVTRFRTDSLGRGSVTLPIGRYDWGLADSGAAMHHITISSGSVTRDTVVICPMCS